MVPEQFPAVSTQELPASQEQLRSALSLWWQYVALKNSLSPDGHKGIWPKLVPDDYDLPPDKLRSIRLSLVKSIAPELAGLGALANASDRPHVYVEGTRHSTADVPFAAIFREDEHPFSADPNDHFPEVLKAHGITPDRFLMYIYSADDLEVEDIVQATIVELAIFSEGSEKLHAFVLSQSPRNFNRNHRPKRWGPRAQKVESLHVVENGIRPASLRALQLVDWALVEALAKITPHIRPKQPSPDR